MDIHQRAAFFGIFLILTGSQAYVIGGGTQPGGGTYNDPTYNNNNNNRGIGGGVVPGGNNNNGGIGGGQNSEGSYCNSNYDCRSGLYCTASVNGVKICLSTANGGGGSGFPTGNGGCQTSSNCQYGSVCVVNNGVGNCQIQAGGYVSPARQEFNADVFSKNAPEPGKLNSGCERDADCDSELSCTLYFGEMLCRFPIKPLIPLRCTSDSECPSTEYLCVFSTAMQDRVCYKYGDVVTDGYVIPIKHKLSMEMKASTPSPQPHPRPKPIPTTTSEPHRIAPDSNGLFAESEAIFDPSESFLLSSTLQKRADKQQQMTSSYTSSSSQKVKEGPSAPMYMKMTDDGPSVVSEQQHDGEAVRMTKVVVKEEKISEQIGKGVEPAEIENEPIDPMATVCEFDYHCRMGESCSGRIRFVDRNVTVCRYDILKKHRQCIYHSDCLSGQRCTSTHKDVATCETDINATLGAIPCFYDYECSGGEKCTLVGSGNGGEGNRKFICRPSPTADPRMNQMCTTNAQCPFQQVCRQSAGISMCVDVSISRNPAMLHERLWRFLRNFIFRR